MRLFYYNKNCQLKSVPATNNGDGTHSFKPKEEHFAVGILKDGEIFQDESFSDEEKFALKYANFDFLKNLSQTKTSGSTRVITVSDDTLQNKCCAPSALGQTTNNLECMVKTKTITISTNDFWNLSSNPLIFITPTDSKRIVLLSVIEEDTINARPSLRPFDFPHLRYQSNSQVIYSMELSRDGVQTSHVFSLEQHYQNHIPSGNIEVFSPVEITDGDFSVTITVTYIEID